MRKRLLWWTVLLVCGAALGSASDKAFCDGTDELPDGLAFYVTMTVLVSMSDIDNASPALDRLQRGMKLSQAEARDVLDKILAASEAFSKESNAYTERVLCQTDGTAPVGSEIYEVFESIDDAKESLGAKHLLAFEAALGVDKAARFQQWLQSEKAGIAYVKSRHKENHEQTGRSPDVTRDEICSRLVREKAKQG